jgi:hypothetical protein
MGIREAKKRSTRREEEFKRKRRVMKKFVTASTKIGMLVLLSVAALAASAKAQSGSGLRANIPFDFTVAG